MKKRRLTNVLLSLALAASMVCTPALTTLAEDAAVPVTETAEEQVIETKETEEQVIETKETEGQVPDTKETKEPETTLLPAPTVQRTEIKRMASDFRIGLNGGSAEWANKITKVTFNGVELNKDQYEVMHEGKNLYLRRTEEAPLIDNKDHETKAKLVVEATGYETMDVELTFLRYGADSFQIRIVGKDGVIYPLKTFSWKQLEAMKQAEPVYFQTGCGVGVTSFKADGVYLEDLFKAAGAEIAPDDVIKVRVGDCVGPESNWTNPEGYRVEFTYGELMEKTRYFFDGAYADPVVKKAFSNGGYGNVEARKALANTQKTEVKPMIALRYVESMFSEGKPVDVPYSKIVENEKATRFLLGLAIDKDENGNPIAEEDGHRWSTSFMTFGVDIVDPDYVPQAPAVTRKEVTRNGEDISISLDEKATKDWTSNISKVVFDGKELRKDQYEVRSGRRGTSLVLKRTDKEPLVSSADRETKATIQVVANGYRDLNEELTLLNYGAKSFQIRIVGKDGKIYPQKTFTWDELEKMAGKEDKYYNTICGMAGLRTFKTQGVLLTDLLDAAGVKFDKGMELQVRTNDSAEKENDSTTDNAYYRNGHFTYEDLMGTTRYFFNGAYGNEAARADILKAMENGNFSDEVRKAVGKVDKTVCGPMIGLRYVESMYRAEDMDTLKNAPYSEMIENERSTRFLFGLAMDENDPTMLKDETTTWSATYCAFGVDIIDPTYEEVADNSNDNEKPAVKPDNNKPVKPDTNKPVKPDTNKPAKPGNVKTGDQAPIVLYMGLFAIAGIAVVAYSLKKRKYTDR